MHKFTSNLRCFVVLFSFMVMFAINMHAQNTPGNVREGVIRIKFTPEKAALLEAAEGSQSIGSLKDASLVNAFNNTRLLNYKRVFRHAGKYEAKHRKYGLHLWYEITYDKSVEVSKAMAFFNAVNGAQLVEPVYEKKKLSGTLTEYPDDPIFPSQWDLDNTGQSGGTPGADISILQAWGIETGDTSVIVAVTDGGIDYTHEDLAANMWTNWDEIPGNGIDDDNNGYIDDIHGYGFGDESPTIVPDDHGTHVGGTIAASTNNGIGIAGIAGGTGSGDGVRLMSLAAFGGSGIGNFAETYIYAADNGAVISQNSWGYEDPDVYDQALLDAIDYFIAEAGYDENGNPIGPMQGGIVICAAGNNGLDEHHYPGYYEPVIAVGGTDHNDDEYTSSNRGDWVELSAPGVNILSSFPGDNYGYLSGTSMACPHVSGVAALIISKYKGDISPNQVWDRLVQTTDPLPGLEFLGSGRLNAFNALQDNDGTAPEDIADLSVTEASLSSLTLQWTAPSDPGNGSASLYDIRYSTSTIDDSNFESAIQVSAVPKPSVAGEAETFVLEGLDPSTTYYVAIKSEDFFGNSSGISNVASSVTLDPPVISVNPVSINSDLTTGETETRTVTVSNEGTGPLEFSLMFGSTEFSPPTSSARVLADNIFYPKRQIPASGMVGDISIRAFVPAKKNARKLNYELYRNVTQYETDFEDFELGDIDGQQGWSGDYGMFTISDELPQNGQQHLKGEAVTLPSGEEYALLFSPSHSIGKEDVSSFWTQINIPDNGTTWEIIPQSPSENSVVTRLVINPDRTIDYLDVDAEDFVSSGISFPEGYVDVKMIVDKVQQTFTLYLNDEVAITSGAFAINIQQIVLLTNSETPGNRFYMDDLKVFDGDIDRYPFLSADLLSATVESGGSVDLNITLDATKLYGGTYSNEIYIVNNDPANPEVILPVTLNVTGTGSPVISVSSDTITFPNTFAGDTATVTLTVSNDGTEILVIDDITIDSACFFTGTVDTTIVIMPFKTYSLDVHFAPSEISSYSGDLTITSNDQAHPALTIPLYGEGVEPPVAVITPDSLSVVLDMGDTTSASLYVSNMGVADLKYALKAVSGVVSLSQDVEINISTSLKEQIYSSEFKQRSGKTDPVSYSAKGVTRLAESVDVLILTPDEDVSDLESALDAFEDINAVIYPIASLPVLSLQSLESYAVVITTNNGKWSGVSDDMPALVGDVLADYVDAGGKVIINNYAYDYSDWSFDGRFMTEGYGPFTGTSSDFTGTSSLGTYDAGHPIMSGVTGMTNEYLWQNPTLAPGATLVADWSDGNHFIAVNPNAVALNILPSDGDGVPGWTGDLPLIYHNAVVWLTNSGLITFDPESGVVAQGDTDEVTVTFDGRFANPGTYNMFIEATTNDPANKKLQIPVEIEIKGPVISVIPDALEQTLEKGGSASQEILMSNSGETTADFSIDVELTNYPAYLSERKPETLSSIKRNTPYSGALLDLNSKKAIKKASAGKLAADLYITDFENFTPDDINDQQEWYGEYGNWEISTDNPNSGAQHFMSVSDGNGQTLALSPVVGPGTETYATIKMMVAYSGTGTTWQVIPQSTVDEMVLTRFSVEASGAIQVLQPAGDGAEYVTIDHALPSGYFELKFQLDRANMDLDIYFDDELVYSGKSFSGNPDNVALLSLMESTGSTFYMDDLSIIDGKDKPKIDYLTISPMEGLLLPGDRIPIQVTFNASSVEFGSYTSDINIHINDNEALKVTVPATMHVVGDPAIEVSPTVLMEDVDYNTIKSSSIGIKNTGGSLLDYEVSILGGEVPDDEAVPQTVLAKDGWLDRAEINEKLESDNQKSKKSVVTKELAVVSGDILLEEDFEISAFPPAGWNVVDNEGTGVVWMLASEWGEGNYTGTGDAATVSSDMAGPMEFDTELQTPAIDINDMTGLILQFTSNYQNYGNSDFLDVDIKTNTDTSWTNILRWNEDHGVIHEVTGELVTLELDPYLSGADNFMVRWHYYDPNEDDYDWYAQIDDVVVYAEAKKWLSVVPASGSVDVGALEDINVLFNSAEMPTGSHVAGLVVTSNAVNSGQVGVVASMNVLDPAVIVVTPDSLIEELVSGYKNTQTITITNEGESDLLFNFVNISGASQNMAGTLTPVHAKKSRTTFNQDSRIDFKSTILTYKPSVVQLAGEVYATDFETLALGDINGQDGWYGEYGSWTVNDVIPYAGNQHFLGYSDGYGYSMSASPILAGAGTEDEITFSMKLNVGGDGVTWALSSQSITDGLINGRLIIDTDRSLIVMSDDGTGNPVFETIGMEVPEGYFDFSMTINKQDTSFSIYFDDQQIFTGKAFSGLGEVFVIESNMELEGPYISIDDFKMYDGTPPAEYLLIDPVSGIIPSGSSLDVDVVFDASALAGGEYVQDLVLSHNDPAKGTIVIPTILIVIDPPVFSIDMESMEDVMVQGETATHVMNITNEGIAPLTYQIATKGQGPDSTTALTEKPLSVRLLDDKYAEKYYLDKQQSKVVSYSDRTYQLVEGDILFSEDFDSTTFPPPGWQVVDNEQTGIVWRTNEDWGMANYCGTGFSATVSSDASGYGDFDTELISPAIATNNKSSLILQFTMNYQNYLNLDFVDVDISTDINTAWRNLASFNDDIGDEDAMTGELITLDLSKYISGATEFRIRWHYYDPNDQDWDWYVQIDDIEIIEGEEPWLTITPAAGTVLAGESMPVSVTINSAKMDPGSYSEMLEILTNDLTNPKVDIPVSVEVLSPCVATGTLLREYWMNISGTKVEDIPLDAFPDGFEILEGTFAGPVNWGSNYGARISGYLCAPQTGEYVFKISSDDQSELYISMGDPAEKVKIAEVVGYTPVGVYNKYSGQTSAPVYLQKGHSYYVEVLHKEAGGGDHVSVGWIMPDGQQQIPIESAHFSPAEVTYRASVDSLSMQAGLRYKYYEANLSALPEVMDENTLVSTGIVSSFDIDEVRQVNDHFVIEFYGYINVPEDDIYRFYISSDDGSQLLIGDDLLIDNNGLHGTIEKYRDVPLAAGYHPVTVRYLEGTGSQVLNVSWSSDSIEKEGIPSTLLFNDYNEDMLYAIDPLIEGSGLHYDYYEGSWSGLPDFNSLESVSSGLVDNFSLDPKEQPDEFGMVFSGYIEVPVTGTYLFATNSDDGSQLFMHDLLVVNNDGLHGTAEKSGYVTLEKGFHPISVSYFDRYGGDVLEVKWGIPGMSTALIPDSVLYNGTLSARYNRRAARDGYSDYEFKVFPNPVKDYMNIRFVSDVDDVVRFSLIDVVGKEYKLGQRSVSAGVNAATFDIHNLSLKKGLYVLNIQSDLQQYGRIKIMVK